MAFTASPALATLTHPYTGLSFGPDGTTATSFVNPQGIAVDQTSGDVYVHDANFAGGKLYKFDAGGNPVDFSALGSNVIEGSGAGGAGEAELAVAPAGSPGGTAGDIYVANNSGAIRIYAPSGTELGELSGGGETCGVAVSPAGHLFLGIYPSKVKEFIPSANPVTSADLSGESSASLPQICNVAADGLANVYAANYSGNQVAKLEGIADSEATLIQPGGSTLGIDPSNNDLYLDRGSAIDQYSAAGSLISTFGGGILSESHGVSVNGAAGKTYAINQRKVVVFDPVAIVPTVTTDAASGVGVRKATLHGKVNPEGIAVTGCKFEYGLTAAYGQSKPCTGAIPTDSADHQVSADIGGLLPETTYHFHVVAENANGASAGTDGTFETGEMAVAKEGVALSGDKAELIGSVLPEGAPVTECRFEYGETASYGNSIGCVENSAQIGQNNEQVPVHAVVSGLHLSTAYHFRLVVKSEELAQPVVSQDASFTTFGPLMESSAVDWNGITSTVVPLEATINPQGDGTSYRVEYVTQGQFEESGLAAASSFPNGIAGIGNGIEGVEVSPHIPGLQPATAYAARIVATNVQGTVYSPIFHFATYPAGSTSSESCPQNEQFRVGPSADLPDCRAYEQVTPQDKFGSDASGNESTVEASRSGDGITSFAFAGFPGGEGYEHEGQMFLSHRDGDDWSTHGLLPPPSIGDNAHVVSSTPDLELTLLMAIRTNVQRGAPGLFLRENSTNSIVTVFPYTRGISEIKLAGTSADDSKVFISAFGPVPVTSGPTQAEPETSNVYLYDRNTGELTLVGLLPDSACGSPPCVPASGSTLAGNGYLFAGYPEFFQDSANTVSESGDVFFVANDGQLYLRRDAGGPDATTVQVSASERTDCADHSPCSGTPEPDPAGPIAPKQFGKASPDGSVVFFTSEEDLTDDANASPGKPDLYRYEVNAPAGGHLTDLAPGAGVGGVLGSSNDGTYVYFAASHVDGSGPTTSGECLTFNESDCNLYRWHDDGSPSGSIAFVAGPGIGYPNWTGGRQPVSRVSANGHVVTFSSSLSLTGRGAGYFRYDDDTEKIACLSCNPTGAPRFPNRGLGLKASELIHIGGAHLTFWQQSIMSRNLSPDGKRFIFETGEKMVTADVNGDQGCPDDGAIGAGPACYDVYEWEAPGKGSCTTDSGAYSPVNAGCLYLISTGTGSAPSSLGDVSESGDTVFFFARDQLVPADKDTQLDIYAATVDGGLASQHRVTPPTCEGDSCRGASSSPPQVAGAGSAAFEGPGNPPQHANKTRCAKGKKEIHSKGKVRCVSKRHKPGRHRKGKRHHQRAANNDRRASR